MPATVICISRTDGAEGEAVGVAVAADLGYRYGDREVVALAAEKARVDHATIDGVETRQSFVRRLLEGLVPSAPRVTAEDPALGANDAPEADTFGLRDVIRSVIAALALRDSDRNRQDYFRRFYGVAEEPTHDDLLMNTDRLTAQQAAAIVCTAARIAN